MTKDARILVTFSKPMNKAATQVAYQSADLPASAVVMTWNADGTVLTIAPNAPLDYATGTVLETPAKTYKFLITNAATSASGLPLETFTYEFTTLRRLSLSYKSVLGLDGYVRSDGSTTSCTYNGDGTNLVCTGDGSFMAANAFYRGFLTFDISAIPAGITLIESAAVNVYQFFELGNPYVLGNMLIEHVIYTALDMTAFNAAQLRPIGVLSTNITHEWKMALVTEALRDDYTNRGTRAGRSQYRLLQEQVSNYDGIADAAFIYNAKSEEFPPRLDVTFLIP